MSRIAVSAASSNISSRSPGPYSPASYAFTVANHHPGLPCDPTTVDGISGSSAIDHSSSRRIVQPPALSLTTRASTGPHSSSAGLPCLPAPRSLPARCARIGRSGDSPGGVVGGRRAGALPRKHAPSMGPRRRGDRATASRWRLRPPAEDTVSEGAPPPPAHPPPHPPLAGHGHDHDQQSTRPRAAADQCDARKPTSVLA